MASHCAETSEIMRSARRGSVLSRNELAAGKAKLRAHAASLKNAYAVALRARADDRRARAIVDALPIEADDNPPVDLLSAGCRTASLQGAERALQHSQDVLAAAACSCASLDQSRVDSMLDAFAAEIAREGRDGAARVAAQCANDEGPERSDAERCVGVHALTQKTLQRQIAIRNRAVEALAALLAAPRDAILSEVLGTTESSGGHWALGDLDFAIHELRSAIDA